MEVEENGSQFIRLEPAKILRLKEENSKLKSTDVNSNYNKSITDKNQPVVLNPPPVIVSNTVSKEIPSIWAGLGDEKKEAEGVPEIDDDADIEESDENFDDIVEVENVFEELNIGSKIEAGLEVVAEGNAEGDSPDEEGSEDEESDDESEDEDDDGAKVEAKVDIDFESLDLFPTLSTAGPMKAKNVWGVKTFATTITEPVCTDSVSTETVVIEPVSTEKIVQAEVSTNVRNWSQIAGKSVTAAVGTAVENNHTTANSAFNSTRDWSRKMKKYKKNNASMPVKVEKDPSTPEVAGNDAGPSVLPFKATIPFFTTKTPLMPSRILSGGNGGMQSAQAAKKSAMEDDGSGWINPTNIVKYRSGASISMSTNDKPTGRGNSGVHTDFKEKPENTITTANINKINEGSGNNDEDTKSIQSSRQSNYKNVPTNAMKSMSSMMMMGKNTITTTIPIDQWNVPKKKYTPSQGINGNDDFFKTAGKEVGTDMNKNSVGTDMNRSPVIADVNASTQHLKISKNKNNNMKTACVTTDFSMQNVLMQMGLNVVSVDGMLVRAAKQWVLRCMACFKVHYEMDRLFCSKCGANHMSRVGASVNAKTGELRLHLKANYVVNTLGTKYSIPKPGSRGRYEGELLLREDQLLSGIWRQKNVKIKKNVTSFFGADVTSDVGIHINKGQAIVVGMGKKNPNSTKGRERRGKTAK
eukprot:CAMPEP_0119034088 /NCGR_PEP_ID=MMETSP1177-20130426/1133_1 /TAXON_ID=2985 /ORGANISM="Ochromonas sp, Strain CCMP1899" /LENGTH=695 /DNA_ID=CAMNT_0006991319 /DNA_START=512 /DNA_END=2599 /DNA_ORIENTATION=+